MSILVCPLSQVAGIITRRAPERIIGLLDPDFTFPDVGPAYVQRYLRLRFCDTHSTTESSMAPTLKHLEALLEFLAVWDPLRPLLIHCRAGIGRSPAAAFIAACFREPDADEHQLALDLLRVAPLSRPNVTMVELADRAMKRGGRMTRAIEAARSNLPPVYANEGTPFELLRRFQR